MFTARVLIGTDMPHCEDDTFKRSSLRFRRKALKQMLTEWILACSMKEGGFLMLVLDRL